LFVHLDSAHLVGNLLFLWIFGKRVERILGPKAFIGLYLTCGLAGGMMDLILAPELHNCGASGAVFGLAGALLGTYGLKVKTLSGKQWSKLLLLLLWSGLGFYSGFGDPSVDNIAHATGFSAGVLLGAIFALRPGWDRRAKGILFAGVGTVLLGMAIWAWIHSAGAAGSISGSRDGTLVGTRG
jgi:rhomboid protease GluP